MFTTFTIENLRKYTNRILIVGISVVAIVRAVASQPPEWWVTLFAILGVISSFAQIFDLKIKLDVIKKIIKYEITTLILIVVFAVILLLNPNPLLGCGSNALVTIQLCAQPLSPNPGPLPVTPMPPTIITGVAINQSNLRNGPSPDYDQVGYVNKDDILELEGQNGLHDWYRLVERTVDSQQQWIWSQNVQLQGNASLLPIVSDYPILPNMPVVKGTICSPDEWRAVCQSHDCPPGHTSQCNSTGTAWVCRQDTTLCPIGQSQPFQPPRRPTHSPGATDEPPIGCTCTQSWLENLIRQNGYEPEDLIPSWDLDHDGKITCEDYKLQTGSYSCSQ